MMNYADNAPRKARGQAVQRQRTGPALADHRFGPVAQREERPNNTGLPDNLKSGIENLSGMSMDHVRVHYNSPQPAQLNAHAYAQGSNIHVAPGQEKHLPHEAWHVVQQAQGRVQPTMQMKSGVPVNDNAGLEREADLMGAKAVQLHASMSDVAKIGASIMKKEEKETGTVQGKGIVQRLVNAPISLNNPYTFRVVPADIGTGTATTNGTRAYVNNPATPIHPTVTFSYGFFPPGAPGPVGGAAPGPLLNIPNPPPGAGNYDAGHALGRQNGGRGDLNNWVFPQDLNINRGWGGTFNTWRRHEDNFRAGVAGLAPGGFGIWHVTLP